MALFSSQPASPDTHSSTVGDYFLKRQISPQWRAFLLAFSSELFQSADPEEAREFLRRVGLHMGELIALKPMETLEELEDEINAKLAEMDWGVVELAPSADGIDILHQASPSVLPDDKAGTWETSVGAILEGLYTQWFISQGSQSHLVSRCIEIPAKGSYLLRHGR